MKKIFVALCCACVCANVSAQDPVEAPAGVEGAEVQIVETPSVNDAAPAAMPVQENYVGESIISDGSMMEGSIVDGAMPMTYSSAPISYEPAPAAMSYAPAAQDCNCGQSTYASAAPVYSAPVSVAAPSYSTPVSVAPTYSAPVAAPSYSAPVSVAAPAYSSGCSTCAQPVATQCCDNGRSRPQVFSRVRSRVSSISIGSRLGNRRNNCCN